MDLACLISLKRVWMVVSALSVTSYIYLSAYLDNKSRSMLAYIALRRVFIVCRVLDMLRSIHTSASADRILVTSLPVVWRWCLPCP